MKLQELFRSSKLPNILRFFAGTLVQIIAPSDNEEVYVNRHNYHSLNVQVICEFYFYKITNVVACWPCYVHDSSILKKSAVQTNFNTDLINKRLLLVDSRYGCAHWLIPYRNLSSKRQEDFDR